MARSCRQRSISPSRKASAAAWCEKPSCACRLPVWWNSAYASNEERLAYLEMVHHEHDSIFAGIAMQSPDSARAAMFLHLNNSRERLRRTRMAKATPMQLPPEA